jgi:DNA-directed RNA polymerase subunit RPC12/RpoP
VTRRLALVLLVVLAAAAVAHARPGGGETYSSGGGSRDTPSSWSSGDSDDGDSDGGADLAALIWLIEFCIRYPKFGVPMVIVVVLFFVLGGGRGGDTNWNSIRASMHDAGTAGVAAAAGAAPARSAPPPVEAIARLDPDFSRILFEDFAFRLYAAAHQRRHDERQLAELAPYVSLHARRALIARQPVGQPVTGVTVGALRVKSVDLPEDPGGAAAVVTVTLEFEANYSIGAGDDTRRFVVEDWVLRRAAAARTRPPVGGQRFTCPNCGAPFQSDDAAGSQKCASCGEVVDNGRFDWQVAEVRLLQQRSRLPGLEQEVPERTPPATRRDPDFADRWRALVESDPALTSTTIEARLAYIYTLLNDAWSRRDLAAARPVLSDGLADYLQYWLDAYAERGLWNVLEDMRLTRHVMTSVRRDRYYDALVIRIWATGKDYVLRTGSGELVRGSRERDRAYSEYWTLIRSAARRGAARADNVCSGCGAPLTIGMAGECAHCGAHVTAGEFDWVLSKIEQDDAYQG